MRQSLGLNKLVVCAFVIAVAFASYGTAATVRAQVDSPVVIGDQVFPAGKLKISEVSDSLLAVTIDGQRVALLHSPADSTSSRPESLAFRRDGQGRLHLLGLNVVGCDGKRLVRFDVASVARGMDSLRVGRSESVARASNASRAAR